jgi:nucleoside-diphosphate-sugar epimerase
MAKSFSIAPDAHPQPEGKRRTVLVTGAAGRLGTAFAQRARDRYDLRLMVRSGEDRSAIETCGEIVEGDLADLEGLKRICEGIDTIVHLAAEPSAFATWAVLLPNNVIGTYNTFVAAKSAGCRRVVFASSIHAVSGYPSDVQVKTSDPANPGDLYGVSKVFGEALGRYMAEQEGVSCIAVRIGAAGPIEWAATQRSLYMMDAFLSYEDLQQLLERAIDDERIQFAIVHGVSDNRFKRLDISTTRALLGYAPKDDLTRVNPSLRDLEFNTLASHSVADGFPSGIRDDL